jgi:hypothetical protein
LACLTTSFRFPPLPHPLNLMPPAAYSTTLCSSASAGGSRRPRRDRAAGASFGGVGIPLFLLFTVAHSHAPWRLRHPPHFVPGFLGDFPVHFVKRVSACGAASPPSVDMNSLQSSQSCNAELEAWCWAQNPLALWGRPLILLLTAFS